ncbi:unnamed protein product [Hapterophycus canaliculatus]
MPQVFVQLDPSSGYRSLSLRSSTDPSTWPVTVESVSCQSEHKTYIRRERTETLTVTTARSTPTYIFFTPIQRARGIKSVELASFAGTASSKWNRKNCQLLQGFMMEKRQLSTQSRAGFLRKSLPKVSEYLLH